jgi:uncharacterized protein (DUF1697 family)
METYVILLRGVMPTGKNRVPMGPLREVLGEAGLENVRTYIQSGNVIARSGLSAGEVEALVHDQIEAHFGGDLAVLARTPDQLAAILEGNPFEGVDTAKVYFTILAGRPEADGVAELEAGAEDFAPDRVVITDEAAYVHCPNGYGRTKLNNSYLERMLGVAATTRNTNTMGKLVEMGRGE